MESTFINKLEGILKDNLSDESFGVGELVSSLNMSRSQLNRLVRRHTKKSPSQFIREYRLEEARKLLVETELTSSEVAYKVGFNSATYFNSSFRKYFGYTPGEAKVRNTYDSIEVPVQDKNKRPIFEWGIPTLILTILIVTSVSVWKNWNSSNPQTEEIPENKLANNKVSIAVLPFKNLSDSEEDDHLAYGIREDITINISKIQNVIVKSPLTIEDYVNQKNSMRDIGKDLNVDYIINGSVQNFQERMRIIIHIIDVKKDNLEISRSFEGSFDDIFELEKEVSQTIATELNLMISPEDLKRFDESPTKNTEAFKLYSKGRYFYYLGAEDSDMLAYQYFQESITIDPEFAMAYVGLADLIDSSYWPWIPEEKFKEMKEYAMKAMSLDNSIPDPHKILAKIYMKQNHNWDAAEHEFQLALKIDPDHIETNIEYGRFLFNVRGDFNKAQELFKKVEDKNPMSLYNLGVSAEGYMAEGKLTEARSQIEKSKEFPLSGMWPGWIYWNSFVVYLMENNPDKAVNELVIGWNHYPGGAQNNIEPLLKAYNNEGIDGIFKWLTSLHKKEVGPDNQDKHNNGISVAEHYAMLGDEEKAISNIELAIKYKNAELYTIKYNPLLKRLRDNPKFLSLLKRLNLGDYEDRAFLK